MNDLNENKQVEETNEEEVLKEEKVEENNEALESEENVALEEEPKEDEEEKLPEMTPIVEVETTYDYKVLKYCNMYVIRVKRKSLLINLIMALVCIAIGGLILYSSLKNQNNNWIFAAMTFVLSAWVIFSIFTEEKRIDKSLVKYFSTHTPVKQKFSFDNERIRITAVINGEEKQADYPWAYVTEIHAIPEYFFLFINGGAPIVIDRSEESIITGTTEDLENLIREECSLKPFKSYTKPLVKHLAEVKYPEPVFEETSEEEVKEENSNEIEDNKNE